MSIFGTERNGSPLTVICPAGAQKCSRRRKACLGWVAAGMLEAERNFRRVRGCKQMPTLVAALRRQTATDETVTPDNYDQAAA